MKIEGRFKGHIYHACLPGEIYFPTLKFQVDRRLGKAYTSLQLHIAGLYHYSYIDKETFEKWTAKYSRSLAKEERPLTKAEIEEQRKIEELEKQFSNILKQGLNMLSEKSRKYWLKKAEEYQGKIPNAKLILALANNEESQR